MSPCGPRSARAIVPPTSSRMGSWMTDGEGSWTGTPDPVNLVDGWVGAVGRLPYRASQPGGANETDPEWLVRQSLGKPIGGPSGSIFVGRALPARRDSVLRVGPSHP